MFFKPVNNCVFWKLFQESRKQLNLKKKKCSLITTAIQEFLFVSDMTLLLYRKYCEQLGGTELFCHHFINQPYCCNTQSRDWCCIVVGVVQVIISDWQMSYHSKHSCGRSGCSYANNTNKNGNKTGGRSVS